jgi:hypothetical protein
MARKLPHLPSASKTPLAQVDDPLRRVSRPHCIPPFETCRDTAQEVMR